MDTQNPFSPPNTNVISIFDLSPDSFVAQVSSRSKSQLALSSSKSLFRKAWMSQNYQDAPSYDQYGFITTGEKEQTQGEITEKTCHREEKWKTMIANWNSWTQSNPQKVIFYS